MEISQRSAAQIEHQHCAWVGEAQGGSFRYRIDSGGAGQRGTQPKHHHNDLPMKTAHGRRLLGVTLHGGLDLVEALARGDEQGGTIAARERDIGRPGFGDVNVLDGFSCGAYH